MAQRRQAPGEDPLDSILERVRRAHEAADGKAEGAVDRDEGDRLERSVARARRMIATPRVDPGRAPAGRARTDTDRFEPRPRPTAAPTRDTEKTLHRFRYPDRGADVPIDSGEGKSFDDPERTRTRIVPRRPRR